MSIWAVAPDGRPRLRRLFVAFALALVLVVTFGPSQSQAFSITSKSRSRSMASKCTSPESPSLVPLLPPFSLFRRRIPSKQQEHHSIASSTIQHDNDMYLQPHSFQHSARLGIRVRVLLQIRRLLAMMLVAITIWHNGNINGHVQPSHASSTDTSHPQFVHVVLQKTYNRKSTSTSQTSPLSLMLQTRESRLHRQHSKTNTKPSSSPTSPTSPSIPTRFVSAIERSKAPCSTLASNLAQQAKTATFTALEYSTTAAKKSAQFGSTLSKTVVDQSTTLGSSIAAQTKQTAAQLSNKVQQVHVPVGSYNAASQIKTDPSISTTTSVASQSKWVATRSKTIGVALAQTVAKQSNHLGTTVVNYYKTAPEQAKNLGSTATMHFKTQLRRSKVITSTVLNGMFGPSKTLSPAALVMLVGGARVLAIALLALLARKLLKSNTLVPPKFNLRNDQLPVPVSETNIPNAEDNTNASDTKDLKEIGRLRQIQEKERFIAKFNNAHRQSHLPTDCVPSEKEENITNVVGEGLDFDLEDEALDELWMDSNAFEKILAFGAVAAMWAALSG